MTRLTSVVLAAMLAASSIRAAVAATDAEAEKASIAKVIDANIGWFATKDFDLAISTVADDPGFFYFSPDSKTTIHGIEALNALSAVWRDPGSWYVSHEIRDLRIHLHPSGQVAWYSAILDDCGEYNGKMGRRKDARWTGVLEKRYGRWAIM